MQRAGFTLIELLVVIAIIAILATIGFSVYSGAQKGVRDSRRKADVDSIAKALEQNYDPLKNRYKDILASDFQAKKVPAPPENPNGFYDISYNGFIAGSGDAPATIKSFQVCARLEGQTTACTQPTSSCFCKTSNQGISYAAAGSQAAVITSGGSVTALPGTPVSLLGWAKINSVNITNSGAGAIALTNYQLKMTVNFISESGMKPDFADVRFVDSQGAELPYYLESFTPSTSAIFWIKVPSIPIELSSIKLVYGNPDVTTTSNPGTVFDVYDDFNTNSLDASKWTTHSSGGGSLSFANGVITLSGGSSTSSSLIRSKAQLPFPPIVEAKVNSISGLWPTVGVVLADTLSLYGFSWYPPSLYPMVVYSYNVSGCATTGGLYASPYGNSSASVGIWKFIWISSNSQKIEWNSGNLSVTRTNYTPGPTNAILGTACNPWNQPGGSISIDWVRARRYANSEPTAQVVQ